MPEVNVNVRDRLASADIDKLDIDIGVDTLLVFPDVPADIFAVHVYENTILSNMHKTNVKLRMLTIGAFRNLRLENAGAVSRKQS